MNTANNIRYEPINTRRGYEAILWYEYHPAQADVFTYLTVCDDVFSLCEYCFFTTALSISKHRIVPSPVLGQTYPSDNRTSTPC